ncbi:hypothetical protein BdWA1_001074 [Babesia duncani]|uniref:Uncharacterized protein n=1 Tax=Babesia duncani TaxID=323732 RepID=A0AAD9UQN8_9APIC|nr:hypothetical protein BdWA1_001074 [Babesia duncani]
MDRLNRKFHEVIKELHGVEFGDFNSSIREEYRTGCLLGKRVFTVDEGSNGITVFMPWRLHAPLEEQFRAHANNGIITVDMLDGIIDDAQLFPSFQSRRKRNDIMGYIFKRTCPTNNGMDFEGFLHTLYLLAKYRAAIFRITEQCSFNHVIIELIKRLTNKGFTNVPKGTSLKASTASVQELINEKSLSIGSISEAQDQQPLAPEPVSEPTITSPSPKPQVLDATTSMSRDSLQFVKKDSKLLKERELLNQNYEKIMLELVALQKDMRTREKLEGDIDNLKGELNRLNLDLEREKHATRDAKELVKKVSAEKEQMATSYTEEINQLKTKLDATAAKIRHQEQVHLWTNLEAQHEAKLFSLFLLYKQPELILGEFCMSERDLATFCADFGLLYSITNENNEVEPLGKIVYRKLESYTNEGCLTFWLFKQFLYEIALALNSGMDPGQAFLQLLIDHVFLKCEYRDALNSNEAIITHPGQVYINDENPSPWDPQETQGNDSESQDYIQVEGKMWFQPQQQDQFTSSHYQTTPRFPDN